MCGGGGGGGVGRGVKQGMKCCSNEHNCSLTKMVAIPICGEKLLKIFFSKTK